MNRYGVSGSETTLDVRRAKSSACNSNMMQGGMGPSPGDFM